MAAQTSAPPARTPTPSQRSGHCAPTAGARVAPIGEGASAARRNNGGGGADQGDKCDRASPTRPARCCSSTHICHRSTAHTEPSVYVA